VKRSGVASEAGVLCALLLGLVPLLVSIAVDNPLLRVFAVPALYLCPGYLVIAALAPRSPLGGIPRLALSITLSLMVLIISAVLLSEIPVRIDARSTALSLATVDGAAALIWVFRVGREVPRWPQVGLEFEGNGRRIAASALGLGVAAAIVVGAYAVTVDGARNQPFAGTVQAWVLQPAAAQDSAPLAQVGVRNLESAAISCQVSGTAPRMDVAWPSFDLEPSASWLGQTTVPASPAPGTPFRVTVHCQLPDGTTLDRSLLRTMA
jgi:hypothetical protein